MVCDGTGNGVSTKIFDKPHYQILSKPDNKHRGEFLLLVDFDWPYWYNTPRGKTDKLVEPVNRQPNITRS